MKRPGLARSSTSARSSPSALAIASGIAPAANSANNVFWFCGSAASSSSFAAFTCPLTVVPRIKSIASSDNPEVSVAERL